MEFVDASAALLDFLEAPGFAATALAFSKGAVSAVGGVAVRAGLDRMRGSKAERAYGAVVVDALGRVLEETVDPPPADWATWLADRGAAVIEALADKSVVRYLASAEVPDDVESLLEHLPVDRRGALEAQGDIDFAGLLRLLPGTITDCLAAAATKPGSPLADAWGATAFREVLARLAPQSFAPLGDSHARGQLSDYLTSLIAWSEHMLYELPYVPGGVPLDDLDRKVRARVGVRRGRVEEADDQASPGRGGRTDPYEPFAEGADSGRETLPWPEAVSRFPMIVLLADPGLGKTWRLHAHARHLARLALEELGGGAPVREIQTPIFARCDTVADSAETSLIGAAIAVAVGQHRLSPGFAAWLDQHAREQRVTVVLDALDELTSGQRAALEAKLATEPYPKGTFTRPGSLIVGSRLAGFSRTQLPRDATKLELLPFTSTDVTAYLQAWGLSDERYRALAERLKNTGLAGLTKVPLLLAMLCAVAADEEAELPSTRVALYDAMLRLFIRAEHRRPTPRNAGDAVLGDPEIRAQRVFPILAHLAHHFAVRLDGWQDRMPTAEILEVLRAAPNFVELGIEPAEFLGQLSKTMGLLIPAGVADHGEDPPFLFLHRTFAEFLTAYHLVATNTWHYAVLEHLWFEPDWEQVVLLAAGLLNAPPIGRPRAEQLLDLLICQEPDPFHHAILVAAKAVRELEASPTRQVRDMADSLVPRVTALLHTPFFIGAVAALDDICTVSAQAREALLVLSADPDPGLRRSVVKALDRLEGEDVTTSLVALASDHDQLVRTAAGVALTGRAGSDVTAALVALASDPNRGVRWAVAGALGRRSGTDVTTALVALASDHDPRVRTTAAVALGRHAGTDATAALVALASEPNQFVRSAAAGALGQQPGTDATTALLALVSNGSRRVRFAVAGALGRRAGKDVTTALVALASDDDPKIRTTAAAALGERMGTDVTTALVALASDHDQRVRTTAAAALGRRAGTDVTTALVVLASDHDPSVRAIGARTLGLREGAAITPNLLVLAADHEPVVRAAAAAALGRRAGTEVTMALVALVADHEPVVRAAAAAALGQHAGPDVAAVLVAQAANSNPEIRRAAAATLCWRAGTDVTTALVTLATDHEPEVRAAAATALGGRAGTDVTAALVALATDHEPEVRRAAAGALGRRAGPDVTMALVALTSDHEPSGRAAAVGALGRRAGMDVTTALVALASDPDRDVRWAVAGALGGRTGTDVTTALVALATDHDPEVRRSVAGALTARASTDVTPALVALASDHEPEVRRAAAGALAARAGTDATTALVALATDPDPVVRMIVARALGGREGPDVTTALEARASDGWWIVRRVVARALGRREGPDVTTALVALTTDPDRDVSQVAAEVLSASAGARLAAALTELTVLDERVLRHVAWPTFIGGLETNLRARTRGERDLLFEALAQLTSRFVPNSP